jgi:hypothetical protein
MQIICQNNPLFVCLDFLMMDEPDYTEPYYEADADIETDILNFFSQDTAAAIRQYTCTALATDLNISPAALEQIIADKPYYKNNLDVQFFARHLHQFV